MGGCVISFFVYGRPAPKGSMRAYVRGARAIVTHDNTRTQAWGQAVACAALDVMRERELMLGAVSVTLRFALRRPLSHYGKRGLRPSARVQCWMGSRAS